MFNLFSLNWPKRIFDDFETTASVKIKREIVCASESREYEKLDYLIIKILTTAGSIFILIFYKKKFLKTRASLQMFFAFVSSVAYKLRSLWQGLLKRGYTY